MLQIRQKQPRQTASEDVVGNAKIFTSPAKGMITNTAALGAPEDSALLLENCIAFQESTALRKGITRWCTLSDSNEVESIFEYKSATQNKLFASVGTNIYDITAPPDPTTPLAPVVNSQTSAEYSTVHMATTSGNYMLIFNGTDQCLVWDASTWTFSTITGVSTADVPQAWVYRNRVFMIEKDSLKFWFLATDAYQGAATGGTLYGVFRKGGSLLFGATWSLDSGAGIDDKCVFVTDRGEVAIYEGGDPSSATDWNLVGVYEIAVPLGKNAWTHSGGTLLIMTQDGIVPITEAIRQEKSVLSEFAVSRNIEPDWRREVKLRKGEPWTIAEINNEGFAVISWPYIFGSSNGCFAVNLQTNAWSCFKTNFSINCVGVFNEDGYCGTEDGKIMRYQVGGQDDLTDSFTCRISFNFNPLDNPMRQKITTMARASYTFTSEFVSQISASTDYRTEWPLPPNSLPVSNTGAVWGTAIWGTDVWGGTANELAVQKWQIVRKTGHMVSMQIQIVSDDSNALNVEFNSLEVTYRLGNIVN